MKLYEIKNWADHYEKAQTRKVGRAQWVPLPCKHDGKGFRRLMAMRNGAAIYGAWVLIVQVAAKCPVRGVLADDDGPLSADDLAVKTGCPAVLFESALEVLSSKQIGWMLVSDYQRDTTTVDELGKSLQLQDSTVQDITGQNRKEQDSRSADVRAVFDHYRTHHPKSHPHPTSTSKEWRNIAARLAEGYSVADLCAAIDGCHKSPFHCGDNERNTKYQGLELIVRDGSKVSEFMNVNAHPPMRGLSAKTQRTLSAAEQFVLERQGDGQN